MGFKHLLWSQVYLGCPIHSLSHLPPLLRAKEWGITGGGWALGTFKAAFQGNQACFRLPRPCDQALVSLLTPAALINLLSSLHSRERWGEGERHSKAESEWKKKKLRREREEKEIGEKSAIWIWTWSTRSLSLCGRRGPSYWIFMSRVVVDPRAIADSHSSCSEVYSRPSKELGLRVSDVWRVHGAST